MVNIAKFINYMIQGGKKKTPLSRDVIFDKSKIEYHHFLSIAPIH
jgi:hypothetical protein